MEMLLSDRVRGLEQAALTLGALDHEPAATRLVALLAHQDPRVSVTSAWALRKLAVRETAAPILARIHDETEKSLVLQAQLDELTRQKQPFPDNSHMLPLFDQLAHLVEALGVMGHREALPELERFFPKPPMLSPIDPPPVATTRQYPIRAAVVDAVGRMFEGEPRADLVEYLAERLSDDDPSHAESAQVRVNAAVALTRLGAKDKVPVLERFYQPETGYSTLVDACAWGLERLAGRPPYDPPPQRVQQFGWFLEPLDP
jgi:HEAT repeat protein